MGAAQSDVENWRRAILRSMPPPAWVSMQGPETDVVLCSRTRFMRNLRGFLFPHLAERDALQDVRKRVLAVLEGDDQFRVYESLSPAEREYFLGCRLVSPHFLADQPGRALILDELKVASVMVNEEDHLRIQALTPGWSTIGASLKAEQILSRFSSRLEFAWSPRFGHLSASPYNCGSGVRASAMFHLAGLAYSKRLPTVLRALSTQHVAARGLYGEASRAVGAFVQVSVTTEELSELVGAGAFLLKEEREARSLVSRESLETSVSQRVEFIRASSGLSMRDALRVLSWLRWAAGEGLPGWPFSAREVDHWLTTVELRTSAEESRAARQRSAFLKEKLKAVSL